MSRRPNLEQRQAILRSAHQLVFRHGLHGVSMDEIAAAAGVKKANLFHYYPSKEALALAVFDYASQAQNGPCFMIEDPGRDPIDAVERLFDRASQNMAESGCSGGCFVGNVAQELSDDNEALRRRASECLSEWVRLIADFLSAHGQAGYFRESFQPRPAAQAILSLFEGALLISKANRSTEALQNAKQMAAAFLRSQTGAR